MLIAVFGGLPLDYRTDPATVNFTDPATVDAIRQVLDLAADGYIHYTALSGSAGFMVSIGGETTSAITTNTLNQFRRFGPPDAPDAIAQDSMVMTPYPQGSQFNAVAYEITTGYISATTQNPEAAYRFLSAVARNPQLFAGMPARQSLVYDPTIMASQGSEIVAVYQQLDALLRASNTLVFPTFTAGRGGGGLSLLQNYWLWRAFDNYVLNGADLETELENAQTITLAYQQCAQSIVVDAASAGPEQQGQMFQAIAQCATTVDPTFSLGD
jgi:ABC-type glycerol-3-phosphate transport system substrate-binding protein